MITQDNIELTDLEAQLFDTLLAAKDHHHLETVLRCAGGWVRDKLLGKESHDIDIALDDLTGREFAEKVNEYLQHQGLPTKSIGVIAANPDQSKHLETATIRVHDLMLDMVNLRSETYSDASRIPQIENGTPQQDAERRDFTVNSLFYNLNDRQVEDLTGKGLTDLKNSILRTPLEPRVTFLDDPLRVLRAVRFAARFGFAMVPDLVAAARTDEVRQALETKVTRERVGVEVAGMMQGPDPVMAAHHLHNLNIFDVVFQPPADVRPTLGSTYADSCIEILECGHQLLIATNLQVSDDQKRVGCLASLMLPLRYVELPLKKGRTQPIVLHISREALKWRAKDGEQTTLLHKEMINLLSIHSELEGKNLENVGSETRVRLGQCLRCLKELAPMAIALLPLLKLKAAAPLAPSTQVLEPETACKWPEDSAALQKLSQTLYSAVASFGLTDCRTWMPLIKGPAIQEVVGMTRPGPLLGKLTNAAMDWQLANPKEKLQEDGSAPPGLIERLKEEYAVLTAQ